MTLYAMVRSGMSASEPFLSVNGGLRNCQRTRSKSNLGSSLVPLGLSSSMRVMRSPSSTLSVILGCRCFSTEVITAQCTLIEEGMLSFLNR